LKVPAKHGVAEESGLLFRFAEELREWEGLSCERGEDRALEARQAVARPRILLEQTP
jgi:hypothetical protein